jgi:hypothetical protein
MNTSHLVGQTVELKIESLDTAVSAVILGVESAGLWIHKGDVVEKIAASQGGARLSGAPKEPAVFLPFTKISWLMTEIKESVYQKAR